MHKETGEIAFILTGDKNTDFDAWMDVTISKCSTVSKSDTITLSITEYEQLKKDAERYRWLNSQYDLLAHVKENNGIKHYALKCGEALDNYIDARINDHDAIAKDKP
jgi:hypothetical protein